MNRSIDIAICQMSVTDSKQNNLNKAEMMITQSVSKNKAQIVVLPEMFNCPYNTKVMADYAENIEGETVKRLSNIAKKLKVYIFAGSFPEKDKEKIYNTSLVFNKEGQLIGKHRKIHLFDVDIQNGIKFKESEVLSPGNDVTVVNTEFCKIGLAICYDMRFPELMRAITLKGAKIIIVPAAFNMTTGPAHWNELLKVRAMDNQVYFIAASPARNMSADYHAYGHSAIVDPWGKIMAQAQAGEIILHSKISLSRVEKIRNELPLLKHRRTDIY
ncbi:carbon-nitrogen hydrolase family protein [Serpentinicella sp. ANB-PHB4]|uniref:carbon-nitrogen hydrolase family protein n=1 Tax=Serpentinicella sp. ANB-PHB4 TaxID=3074076 RepID=UPI0028597133|nr:carbon-nitrogen hydrolase family protein [Serpentinicella sp. ANB-PHB4]MDR5658349.1 carbon-nitrogen hydrolase family protein [Serpentinicella sp. ANB-PHB4]